MTRPAPATKDELLRRLEKVTIERDALWRLLAEIHQTADLPWPANGEALAEYTHEASIRLNNLRQWLVPAKVIVPGFSLLPKHIDQRITQLRAHSHDVNYEIESPKSRLYPVHKMTAELGNLCGASTTDSHGSKSSVLDREITCTECIVGMATTDSDGAPGGFRDNGGA